MIRTFSLVFLFLALPSYAASSLRDIYEDFHRHPELSFKEEATAKKMANFLREAGFEVTEKFGGFGVVAVLKNGPGKTVLVRTDLDALPVEEQTGLKYASENKGVMHACGHDVHMTNLISLARELSARKSEWKGTVILIGQPAEERGGGAKAMLEDGLFKKFPKPDYAIAFHVGASLETGKVGYISGPAMATADSVDITLKGRGGHGAMPHLTIDPVPMAAQFILDLQSVISREKDPNDASVVTVGSLHCGTKHNIISDECKLQLTVRSFTDKERSRLFKSIERKAKAAAMSAGAPEPEIKFSDEGTPALTNDAALVEKLVPIFKRVLGAENVVADERVTVSEDFSRYGIAGVPIAMFRLGSISPKRLEKMKKSGEIPSLHSAKYFPDVDEAVATGTKTFFEAVKFLTQ